MNIAILSGKGGTGKTLVSVNLAAVAKNSMYIDCDVEEPNGHLFFKPINIKEEKVAVKIPVVDEALCNGCRKCADFCKFNALVYAKDKLIIFDDVCHSCGGCVLVCPKKAISEKDKIIGKVEKGVSGDVQVWSGILNIGEATGIPIIKKLLDDQKDNKLTFIDCPPGTACIVMESIKDADYCVLVAEPTTFGAHNLNMVYELVSLFEKPFGVILNKYTDGYNPSEEFCKEKNIKILAYIPFDKELGSITSNANIASLSNDKYKKVFAKILDTIKKEVSSEAVTNS